METDKINIAALLKDYMMQQLERERRHAVGEAAICGYTQRVQDHIAHAVYQAFLAGTEAVLEWKIATHEAAIKANDAYIAKANAAQETLSS